MIPADSFLIERLAVAVSCVCLCARPAFTQPMINAVAAPNARPEPDQPRTVELSVTPAPEPDPALRYLLLPPFTEQTEGNAASLLYMATTISQQVERPEDLNNNLNDWLELNVADLPRERIEQHLKKYDQALHYLALGARCDRCDWGLPARSEHYALSLAPLSELRFLSRLLALRTRLALHERDFAGALYDLQTGLAIARHIGNDQPTIIQALVGAAVARLMMNEVERWIATPDSPNLYWALIDLPRPFVRVRTAFDFERQSIELALPELRDLDKHIMTPGEAHRFVDRLFELNETLLSGSEKQAPVSWQRRLAGALLAAQAWPEAKVYLLAHGWSEKAVEEMPIAQATAILVFHGYTHQRDELFKWFGLPYWQARYPLRQAETAFQRSYGAMDPAKGFPLIKLLPALSRARYLISRPDQDTAGLAVLEALRMHAAGKTSGWPTSTEALPVPVMIDPITGRAFPYQVEDSTAVVILERPEEDRPKDETHYRLTLSR
jgi:hypothetical protein